MKKVIYIISISICILLLSCCDDHRDLYSIHRSMMDLLISWKNSGVKFSTEEEMGAYPVGILLYKLSGDSTLVNDIHSYEHHDSIRINANAEDIRESGNYMAIVFNGRLNEGINYVRFKDHDKVSTFKAEATLNTQIKSFAEAPPFINNPDTLAVDTVPFTYSDKRIFIARFVNGIEQEDYLNPRIYKAYVKPQRVTYKVRLKIKVIEGMRYALHDNSAGSLATTGNTNKKYRIIANGFIQGFARGCNMYNRMPLEEEVSQAFTLNGLRLDDGESGIDSTTIATFSSFGPPLDKPDRKYLITLYFTLNQINGGGKYKVEEFNDIDVTEAINKKITSILSERKERSIYMESTSFDWEIPINLEIRIKGIGGSSGGLIGLDEWDEINVELGNKSQ